MRDFSKHEKINFNDKQILFIKPSVKLPISAWDNKQEHIIKTIEIGYNDVVNKSTLIKELLFTN